MKSRNVAEGCTVIPQLRIFADDGSLLDADADYTELPPWPEDMRVAGSLRQWQKVAFEGEELIGVLWRSEPGTIRIAHYPYDQTVVVLRGELTLTPEGGAARNYSPGSVFLIPRGFRGLWVMTDGDYEEFIVVERSTFLSFE